ncbi:hypothetical protein JCM8547_001336 [Rhodosporidiobolus lusitaniae]
MLSSFSSNLSGLLGRTSSTPHQEDEDAHVQDEEELVHDQDHPAHLDPHTPEQSHASLIRLSPNSLSASGNQTMTSVLSAHPHFSVFRKNNSGEGRSFEDLVASVNGGGREESPLGAEGGAGRGDFNMRDLRDDEGEEEAVETLATPPNNSPGRGGKSPSSGSGSGDGGNTSSSSSFHLSLDSHDIPSLNFGDASSLSLSPASQPPSRAGSVSPSSRSASPAGENSTTSGGAGGGSVRLVPDSPPVARTPFRSRQSSSSSSSSRPPSSSADENALSRSSSSLSRSERKMRSSSSGPVQRVQFSPLSLCPSPLINAPALPPPPPPPPFSSPPSSSSSAAKDVGETPASAARGILRAPRTPGTGRSVRFSASTAGRPPVKEAGEEREEEEEEEEEEEGPEDSPSVQAGSRSMHRSFGAVSSSSAKDSFAKAAGEEEGDSGASTVSPASSGREEPSPVLSRDHDHEQHSPSASHTLDHKLNTVSPSSPDVSLSSLSLLAPVPSSSSPAVGGEQDQKAATAMLFDESNPFLHLASNTSISLAASTLSSTSTASNADPSLSLLTGAGAAGASATLLMDGSLAPYHGSGDSFAQGAGGGVNFGGESFAQVSDLQLPHRMGGFGAHELSRLSELDEDEDGGAGEGDGTAEVDTSRTPRRVGARGRRSTTPPLLPGNGEEAVPFTRSTATGRESEPLRESDMSSVAVAAGDEERTATLAVPSSSPERTVSPGPPAYSSLPLSPSPSLPPTTLARSCSPSPPSGSPTSSAFPSAAEPEPDVPKTAITSSSGTGTGAGGGMSFYRLFMSSRSRASGPQGSRAAREEWERLERGEKGSPKEGLLSASSAGAGVPERDEQEGREEEEVREEEEGMSVYFSPRKEFEVEEEEEEEDPRLVGSEREYDEQDEDRLSVVEHEMAGRGTFLSPIVEVSEPESNANTPFDPSSSSSRRPTACSSAPLPPQPSFTSALSTSLSALPVAAPPATPSRALTTPSKPRPSAPSTPSSASKIPRPRNPITPSQNPFLLQLARAAVPPSSSSQPSTANKAASLLHNLFSAQSDQLATSSSQRFLLSSLVTNMQNEVEVKDKIVENLKRQVEEARREVGEVEEVAVEWERRFRLAVSATPRKTAGGMEEEEREKERQVAALEETVALLADELETRVSEDRAHRRALERELAAARVEQGRWEKEAREAGIRVRFSEEKRERAEREVGEGRKREEGMRREWEEDVRRREEGVRGLREEVERLKAGAPASWTSSAGAGTDDPTALEEARREVALLKSDLLQRDSALASLRQTVASQRSDLDRAERTVLEERQRAELVVCELTAALEGKEEELRAVEEERERLADEVEEVLARLDASERERDRAEGDLRKKEDLLRLQLEENASALSAMTSLSSHVQQLESDLHSAQTLLEKKHKEVEQQRRESEDVLEKRERVLAEAEKREGRVRKELEGTRKEMERLEGLVGKLRRDSADREVKITKLKKRAAELEEDVFGLNIALDAKQQEASHWKRQMSTLKHERERAAINAAALADSTSSFVPPSTASRPAFAPISAHSTSTVRRSSSTLALSAAAEKHHAETPLPAEKPSSRTSRSSTSTTATTASTRPSIARCLSSAVVSSATESEADDPAGEQEESAGFSRDLTLPPTEYEKTPSRPQLAAVRRSSSSLGLGAGKSRTGGEGRERTRRSSKENEPPSLGQVERDGERRRRSREAVLA